MKNNQQYMLRAIELAKQAESWTNPNPLVGAVIVKDEKIVGEGYHEKFGEAHAEVNAIKSVSKNQLKGSTMYVCLEPCNNHGNTPPCVDAIIDAGIAKVIFSCSDPDQKNNNNSGSILLEAGIAVESGLLEKKSTELNAPFLFFHKNQRPYVAIKFASSLDGKLATKTNDSKWISNEKSRLFARDLRAKYQAILVGSNTVINDNPHLGVRQINKKDPLRIILDTELKTDPVSQVYRNSNVLVFCGNKAPEQKLDKFKSKKIEVIQLLSENIYPNKVMEILYNRKIISLLVEGGGKIIGSFIDEKLVNKIYGIYAPVLVGGKDSISISGSGFDTINESLKLNNIKTELIDDNVLITADTIVK